MVRVLFHGCAAHSASGCRTLQSSCATGHPTSGQPRFRQGCFHCPDDILQEPDFSDEQVCEQLGSFLRLFSHSVEQVDPSTIVTRNALRETIIGGDRGAAAIFFAKQVE